MCLLNRFETTQLYLIDLLRAYGHRPIIVKVKRDGELVRVMARTFVKRQLAIAGISFPYNEINKKNTRIINSDLDNDELSIIFHRAVFDLETAYVEEFCQGKPETEDFVNAVYSWIAQKKEWLQWTFPYYAENEFEPFLEELPEPEFEKGYFSSDLEVNDEYVKALKKMGYKQISSVHAMAQLFWSFASYRQPIEKLMKNAILSITVDEEAVNYFISYLRFYNKFIQEKIDSESFPIDKKESKKNNSKVNELISKHQAELKELNKKYRLEIEERTRKYKIKIAELNTRYQEQIHRYKSKSDEYGVIIEKFRRLVINPHGKINQTYDLTNKEDIIDFISWFNVIHRKIKNQTVKNIVNVRFDEDEEKAELFKKMVDDYNSTLTEESDIDEIIEECTAL